MSEPFPLDVGLRTLRAEGASFGAFNVTAVKGQRNQRQDLERMERSEVQRLAFNADLEMF